MRYTAGLLLGAGFLAGTGIIAVAPSSAADADPLSRPAGEEWLSYHGDYSGRHYATGGQINLQTVALLKREWVSGQSNIPAPTGPQRGPPREMLSEGPTPVGSGRTGTAGMQRLLVRSIPLMHEGVLYFTIGVHAYAIDARTGAPRWEYIADSTSLLSNRGLGYARGKLFMVANGGLTAIDAKSGKELWRQPVEGPTPASAPMVIGNHVFISIGSDGVGARGSLQARNLDSGALEWRWLATPLAGQPGAETWPDELAAAAGVGTPWQPLTYDAALNLLYVGTGNPGPMKDGRTRPGDNVWTSSIVALHADTGTMAWYFQMTPHDDHDYDGNQVTMLFEAKVNGVTRQLLGLIGRNGFLFVVDRIDGKSVTTRQLYESTNWSRFIRPNGTPEPDPAKSPSPAGVLVSPSSDGTANFPATAFSPQTGLIYANTVNSWSMFYTSGETVLGDFRNSLRAFEPISGRVVWSHDYLEPYGENARYPGVLATAGGLIFTGDVSGNVVAFNARTGAIVWHDELPRTLVTNAPISFMLDGKQYVVVGTGDRLIAYALAKQGQNRK
jgi:PQQ-dependent dehydrogenase (methanol/ethanol family)